MHPCPITDRGEESPPASHHINSLRDIPLDEFVGTLEAGLREIANGYPALIDRACAVLAEQLSLPEALENLAAELRGRAHELEDVAVDPMLKSFVLRASDEALVAQDLITSLLTQLASKPPHEWADADEDQFQVRAAHVARAFRSAESLLVAPDGTDAGHSLLRLAVARRGHPEHDRVLPLRPTEEARIAALRDRILATVKRKGSKSPACNRDQALAALALAAESLIDASEPALPRKDAK